MGKMYYGDDATARYVRFTLQAWAMFPDGFVCYTDWDVVDFS